MNVKLKFLLILAALSGALTAAAQRPVPFMWIPKGVDTMQRNKFFIGGYPTPTSRSKADIINTAMARALPPAYIYSPGAISQLISLVNSDNLKNSPQGNGIRLYFAAYDTSNVPTDFSMGPTITDKQVILLFCGSTGAQSADDSRYYVISPVDMQPHVISTGIWRDWCRYYYSNEDNTDGLVSTLELGHPVENQNSGTDFDTRSIYYEMDHFKEFLDTERVYQDTCQTCNPIGVLIDSIGVYFADYLNTGIGANPYGQPKSNYKDRLIVLFEFLRGSQIFFIEDSPGFCDRPPFKQCTLEKGKKRFIRNLMGGGDNGQLCPPNCPCPTGCP